MCISPIISIHLYGSPPRQECLTQGGDCPIPAGAKQCEGDDPEKIDLVQQLSCYLRQHSNELKMAFARFHSIESFGSSGNPPNCGKPPLVWTKNTRRINEGPPSFEFVRWNELEKSVTIELATAETRLYNHQPSDEGVRYWKVVVQTFSRNDVNGKYIWGYGMLDLPDEVWSQIVASNAAHICYRGSYLPEHRDRLPGIDLFFRGA